MKMIRVLIKAGKAVLLTIGAAVVLLAGIRLGQSEMKEPAVSFETSRATRGWFEQTISSTGTMEAVGTVDVGTQASGTIARVYVDYNSNIIKGEILAELDNSLFIAEVKKSEAAVLKAEATLEKAGADYARDHLLFKQGHIAEEDFIETKTQYKHAEADVLSAEAVLDKARINLNHTTIRSPIDGTVIEKTIEAGQTVAASYNTPTLFIIADNLSRMRIEVDVDESDIGAIKTGQPVRFTVQAYPDHGFEGIVSQIRLKPDTISNVVTYTVVVEADNTKNLLMPGMTATADFVVHFEESVLTVPNAALKFRPDPIFQKRCGNMPKAAVAPTPTRESGIVFVLDDQQKIKAVRVKKGKSENGVTIITEGLNEGDRVITGMAAKSKKRNKRLLTLFMDTPRRRGGSGPERRPF